MYIGRRALSGSANEDRSRVEERVAVPLGHPHARKDLAYGVHGFRRDEARMTEDDQIGQQKCFWKLIEEGEQTRQR